MGWFPQNINWKIIITNLILYIILLLPLCYVLPAESRYFNIFLSFTYRYYSLGIIYSSLLIFLIFRNKNFTNNIINYISSSVFAIYLIHENPYVSRYMYIKPVQFFSSLGIPSLLSMLIVTVLLFSFCILIDQIRILLFRILKPLFNRVIVLLTEYIKNLLSRLNLI